MAYKRLWVLLEGNDDERFFDGIIKPKLSHQYNSIQVWQYAQEPVKRTKNFLKSIKAMNSDYFFLVDINRLPCVAAKKNRIKRKYGAIIDLENIITVVKEIESWYFAGLDNKTCQELGLSPLGDTDQITKEDFNSLIPKRFDSRINFMLEILKVFSLDIAIQKNKSFDYFMKKIQVA